MFDQWEEPVKSSFHYIPIQLCIQTCWFTLEIQHNITDPFIPNFQNAYSFQACLQFSLQCVETIASMM